MVATPINTSTGNPVSNSPAQVRSDIRQAEKITPIRRREAAQVAAFELQQVLDLLEQLEGDDWTQPTECPAWNVRAMTAHLAGGCAGWARWRDFRRQTITNPYILRTPVPIDAINRREVEDRATRTPRQLIDELREVGPVAIRNRKNLPGFLRWIRMPASPMPGMMSLAYLADVVYPRDQWMHRMDLCRSTGRAWVTNPDHDRRLMDLIMRDIALNLRGRINVIVNVNGALQASYRFGTAEPQAEIDIDLFTLNRRSSLRITADEALDTAEVRGNRTVAQDFLQHCAVLY